MSKDLGIWTPSQSWSKYIHVKKFQTASDTPLTSKFITSHMNDPQQVDKTKLTPKMFSLESLSSHLLWPNEIFL